MDATRASVYLGHGRARGRGGAAGLLLGRVGRYLQVGRLEGDRDPNDAVHGSRRLPNLR